MFKDEMIAPCGLNCTICRNALKADQPCEGCLGPDAVKGPYCKTCRIVFCETRENFLDRFCDQCAQYPCADVMEKEIRYANAYPLVESPIGNLAAIREIGMVAFLKKEEARWRCPACGGVVCVHTGICSNCGSTYTVRSLSAQKI